MRVFTRINCGKSFLHPESGSKRMRRPAFDLPRARVPGCIYFDVYKASPDLSRMRKPGGEPGVAITASVRATRIAVYGPAGDARFIEYRLTVNFFYPSSYLSRCDHSYDKQLYPRTIMPAENWRRRSPL